MHQEQPIVNAAPILPEQERQPIVNAAPVLPQQERLELNVRPDIVHADVLKVLLPPGKDDGNVAQEPLKLSPEDLEKRRKEKEEDLRKERDDLHDPHLRREDLRKERDDLDDPHLRREDLRKERDDLDDPHLRRDDPDVPRIVPDRELRQPGEMKQPFVSMIILILDNTNFLL